MSDQATKKLREPQCLELMLNWNDLSVWLSLSLVYSDGICPSRKDSSSFRSQVFLTGVECVTFVLRIIWRFWETAHLPLPKANIDTYLSLRVKCWLRGGVGGQFPRNVKLSRFAYLSRCSTTEQQETYGSQGDKTGGPYGRHPSCCSNWNVDRRLQYFQWYKEDCEVLKPVVFMKWMLFFFAAELAPSVEL